MTGENMSNKKIPHRYANTDGERSRIMIFELTQFDYSTAPGKYQEGVVKNERLQGQNQRHMVR